MLVQHRPQIIQPFDRRAAAAVVRARRRAGWRGQRVVVDPQTAQSPAERKVSLAGAPRAAPVEEEVAVGEDMILLEVICQLCQRFNGVNGVNWWCTVYV